MRKWSLFIAMVLLLIFCSPVYAQMMNGSVAVKVDYISFPDGDIKDDNVDTGTYIGIEAFKSVMGGLLHVGGEIGYANPNGSARYRDTEFIFIPVEANAKFVSSLGENLSYGIGLGISMIFVDLDGQRTPFVDEDNWLWGAQLFGELNYTLGNLILGLDVKYHRTESFKDDDYHNYRAGAHIGWKF